MSSKRGSTNEGRVEHYDQKNNKWKPICGDYFNKIIGDVICRQLGYKLGAEKIYQKHDYGEGEAKESDDYILPTLHCSGFETNISNCTKNDDSKCSTSSAGVKCLTQEGCPPGWDEFQGDCFKAVSGSFSYINAIKTCEKMKSIPASPTTSAQMSFLTRLLKNNGSDIPSVWIGLSLVDWSDKSTSLNWVNTSKSIVDIKPESSFWLPVENFTDNDKTKPCIGIKSFTKKSGFFHGLHHTEEYWWSDFGCFNEMGVVCQRNGLERTLSLAVNSKYNYECYENNDKPYIGTYSKTESNFECQNWPEETLKKMGELNGVHNYCRNADGKTKPWCYLNTEKKHWEYCSLPICTPSNAFNVATKKSIDTYKIGMSKGGCQKDTFFCNSGKTGKCLSKFMVCDGYADCDAGEDEDRVFCGDDTCDSKDFLCPKDKFCISKTKVCDGYSDCSDNSDERNCKTDKSLFDKTIHLFSSMTSVTPYAVIPDIKKEECVEKCLSIATYYKYMFSCQAVNYKKESKKSLSECRLLCKAPQKTELITNSDFDLYTIDISKLGRMFSCKNGRSIDTNFVCDGVNQCGDGSDEVKCKAPSKDYKLRMIRMIDNENIGRIEMRHLKDWGYICSEGFNMISADVACRELGYDYAVRFMTNQEARMPYGIDRSILSKVQCKGTEKFLKDCPASKMFEGICSKRQAVVVECSKKRACRNDEFKCKKSGKCIHDSMVCDFKNDCDDKSDENQDCSIKAIIEGGSSKGRVLLVRGSTNGTVCADGFDDNAAKVACKMLGYEKHAKVISSKDYGPGRGLIVLDKLKCTGNEATLLACSHSAWGKHTCSHNDDVVINCKAKKDKPKPKKEIKLPECGSRDNELWFGTKLTNGGYLADDGGFPWMARFVSKNRKQVCLGAIVSDRWVITAASCFDGMFDPKGNLEVIVGDINSTEISKTEKGYKIAQIHLHPDYRDPSRFSNDMAMVKLHPNKELFIKFNNNVKHVCIPQNDDLPTSNCLVAGWGNGVVMKIGTSEAFNDKKCETFYEKIPAKMMCASSNSGLVDICKGDIGSPIICPDQKKFKLYGLTSYMSGCGRDGFPTVYSRPQYERTWINELLAA